MISKTLSRRLSPLFVCAVLMLPMAAMASKPKPTTIDLSAEASTRAENDLGRAQLYFETSDSDPAKLAGLVNRTITEALEKANKVESVTTSTAGTSTYPVHNKDGTKIEGWRMRSTIELESRDLAALSTLIGELQQSLALSSVSMRPASDTRRKAADLAAVDAIRAFEERAEVLAGTLNKKYRISNLSVQHGGGMPVYPMMMRAAAMDASESSPAPLQGGHSEITVNVSGTIELID